MDGMLSREMVNPNDTRTGSPYRFTVYGKTEKDLARRVAKFEALGCVKAPAEHAAGD